MIDLVQREGRGKQGKRGVQGIQGWKLLLRWLLPVLWADLIFYLSSIPNLAVGEGTVDFLTRKPAHIIEYAVLFLLLFRAVRGSFGELWRFSEIAVGAGIISFLYGITDEIHQALTPTRSGKITDLGFDLLGILFALFLLSRFRKNVKL